jgi:hypothetical protein
MTTGETKVERQSEESYKKNSTECIDTNTREAHTGGERRMEKALS